MNRILFIEDDEALALGVEYTLQEEGYEVIHTSTAKGCKDYISPLFF